MKEIKEFDNFSGTDGYVIVDGITSADAGGKKLLSTVGRLTPVSITDAIVSDGNLTISPANHTLVTVTNLPNTSYNFVISAPQISQDDYIDIVIQVQTNSSDSTYHTIVASGFANVTMDDYGGKSNLEPKGRYTLIHLIGHCMTISTEGEPE